MKNTTVILLALFAVVTGCALVGHGDVADDGAFLNGASDVESLGSHSIGLSTVNAYYVSDDDGRRWTGVFALPQSAAHLSVESNAGGASGCAFFVISDHDAQSQWVSSMLTEWSAKTGINTVSQLPPAIRCQFVSDKLGGYVHGGHVFFTGDGGATWKEAQAFEPPDLGNRQPKPEFENGFPTSSTYVSLAWASPSAAVVVAYGDLAVFDVSPNGKSRRRWLRKITSADGIDELLAVGSGEIWLRARLPLGKAMSDLKVCMFKVPDGTPIERGGHWTENGGFLLTGGNAFVADDHAVPPAVTKFELTKSAARSIATVASSSSIVDLVFREQGGILFFTNDDEAAVYAWDGAAGNATVLKPQIDNAIIRKEYLGPDHVTAAELNEVVAWMHRAGRDASTRISTVVNQHPEWSKRIRAQWIIEQCKIAVANHGAWNPPTTLPSGQPVGG